jgi:hypothetical protein
MVHLKESERINLDSRESIEQGWEAAILLDVHSDPSEQKSISAQDLHPGCNDYVCAEPTILRFELGPFGSVNQA